METKGKEKEREGKKSDHPELRRIVKGLLAATGEEEQVRLLQQIEKKLLTGYRIRVGSLRIEPLVLEAYYYHETHFADANTHRAPEQKEWDQLYRHCKKADMDPSGRTGGVDLCLACQEDGEEHWLSFLIKNAWVNGEFCRQVRLNAILNREVGEGSLTGVLEKKKEVRGKVAFIQRAGLTKDGYARLRLAAVALDPERLEENLTLACGDPDGMRVSRGKQWRRAAAALAEGLEREQAERKWGRIEEQYWKLAQADLAAGEEMLDETV